MRKRTLRIILIFIVCILLAGIYIVLHKTSPKNADYFPLLAVLILLDIYLWNSLKWLRRRLHHFPQTLLWILYWSPFLIILTTILLSILVGFSTSNSPFWIYLMGFVFLMYASKIIPEVCLGIADLIRGIQMLIRRLKNNRRKPETRTAGIISRNKWIRLTGLAIGLSLFILFMAGMTVWPYRFTVREQHIAVNGLADTLKGLRIVQISDIHLGSWPVEKKLEEAVQMVDRLNPDLIFFTGDLVNLYTSEAFPFEPILQKIQARYGVYAILGNHDYGDYITWDSEEQKNLNLLELEDFIGEVGWILLRNSNEIVEINGKRIAVIGVDNWSVYSHFSQLGDLDKALEGIQGEPVQLLLSHDPSHWDQEIITRYPDIDITFSGHTHGFQFGIEGKNFRWSPVQFLYPFWLGLYEHLNSRGEKQYLYVNPGLGTIGYPGRVGILPEITLFILE